jgi:phosphoenolpyruvate carboxykinase (ATP)
MDKHGLLSSKFPLQASGILKYKNAYCNLTPAELIEHSILKKEGRLTSTGALMVDTGEFTGRSPKDKYFVKDASNEKNIWWGDINQAVDESVFDGLLAKMIKFIEDKDIYVRDLSACAHKDYKLTVRVITSTAFHNLFAYNMFIRPSVDELITFIPEFTIICIPEFYANPETDKVKNKNFAIINLSKKTLIIGGTGYTGEIKKGIFTVLNYILPQEKNVLSMHCSANVGKDGDTAIFFGLSGTGKTTLSTDPNRMLIGDDEHGWSDEGVFNFEGGCYAKVINLSAQNEPEIFNAIKFGSLLENTRFYEGTRDVNYADISVTQNTRVSYPIDFIANALKPSIGGIPKNIFFLTADAFGVLPPIAKLNKEQAMFHFISGYTSKVAGTEMGVTEPQMVFSTCFGAPFLPLHPTKYAKLLGEKMEKYNVNVWMINTGWSGGPYGVGSRMKLSLTRAMITAAIEGKLDSVVYEAHPIFKVLIPGSCPEVPYQILNPRNTWQNKESYDEKAKFLANAFIKNFNTFADVIDKDILKGMPQV